MNNLKIKIISNTDIESLNNEQLLELYKIIKNYINNLENRIQKVKEND